MPGGAAPLQIRGRLARPVRERGRVVDREAELRRGGRIERVQRPEQLAQRPSSEAGSGPDAGADEVGAEVIDVIATTISGSLADQRKVGRIGPAFRARTRRPVRVHAVDNLIEDELFEPWDEDDASEAA